MNKSTIKYIEYPKSPSQTKRVFERRTLSLVFHNMEAAMRTQRALKHAVNIAVEG